MEHNKKPLVTSSLSAAQSFTPLDSPLHSSPEESELPQVDEEKALSSFPSTPEINLSPPSELGNGSSQQPDPLDDLAEGSQYQPNPLFTEYAEATMQIPASEMGMLPGGVESGIFSDGQLVPPDFKDDLKDSGKDRIARAPFVPCSSNARRFKTIRTL